MFASDQATLDVSFEVAVARLAALTGSGVLTRPTPTPRAPRPVCGCWSDPASAT
jgi:hypothetical protein